MKIIKIPHKACAINCAWNGIEDQYEGHTKERPTKYLFFCISGMLGPLYLENKAMHISHFNNEFTKNMYEFMKDIIGYETIFNKMESFEESLRAIKEYIDKDIPVILGALDMYHLPYFEWAYHKIHIPIHYITAVGYDDENNRLVIYDNDRGQAQEVSYKEFQNSWNMNAPYMLFTTQFKNPKSLEEIACIGFTKKAELILNSSSDNQLSINRTREFGDKLIKWKEELDGEEYKKRLLYFVEYTGFPPLLPKELLPYEPVNDSPHMAGRDIIANTLNYVSEKYNKPYWKQSAELFRESGKVIEVITKDITDFLLGKSDITDEIRKKFYCVADIEEKAYRMILRN